MDPLAVELAKELDLYSTDPGRPGPDPTRGARVLELGCGTGELLADLKPSFGVGVDFSQDRRRLGTRHANGAARRNSGTPALARSSMKPAARRRPASSPCARVKISSNWYSFEHYGRVMSVLSLSWLFGDAAGRFFLGRLIAAGFSVLGYDIDPAKGERLAKMGGKAGSLAEVAQCSRVILAVFSTDQVEDVTQNSLVPAAAGTSKIVLCTSTCDPDRIAALEAKVAPKGIRFLETPVSGTSEQVRQGDGVGLIGGDPKTADEVKDILDVIFPRRFHIGRPGDGGRAKLAVNLILGLNRLALAEGLTFAAKMGLDPKAFIEVAKTSAAYSQVMETKARKMIERDFAPEGRVKQTLKDAHMMLDQAKRIGQQLPALSVHADVLESCVRAGEADFDNSAIVEEIRRRTQ